MCAHTHPFPPPQHMPARSLHFSMGGRQGKMQEVKVSPHQSIISSLKPKQNRNYQLYIFFFPPSRKGAVMIKSTFLNEKRHPTPFVTHLFQFRQTSFRHPAGCRTVSWHLGLCPILFIYFFYFGEGGRFA